MGAANFTTQARGATARDAFTSAVRDAQYEHGHGGYSGTIAEKDSFVLFTLPSGLTVDNLEWAISVHEDIEAGNDDEWTAKHRPNYEKVLRAMGASKFIRLFETYDDKWGPAVCVRTGDTWTFLGMASE